MRVLLSSPVRYPADDGIGSGPHPRDFPSGSGFHLHDLLARGLAELGYTVFYRLTQGATKPLPPGVRQVLGSIPNVDIFHTIAFEDADLVQHLQSHRRPWVATCHGDARLRGGLGYKAGANWIFVSRSLAHMHGCTRYVLNGLDPADYIYSSAKEDYVLFLSSMLRAREKGLDLAVALAKKKGFRLVVAGTATTYQVIESVAEICKNAGAEYVGDVRGTKKAELLAAARAFLFPSRLDEGFGLTMVEALMSGTPVICSDRGACPEIITSDVGFVCREYDDYLDALDRIAEIDSQTCRDKAVRDFHYLRMARDYADEYPREISRSNSENLRKACEVIRAHRQTDGPRPAAGRFLG